MSSEGSENQDQELLSALDNLKVRRTRILEGYAATAEQTAELLTYNDTSFDFEGLPSPIRFPLTPEPHLEAWERYAAEASTGDVVEVLKKRLPQLNFPIEKGISETADYRAATRRGTGMDELESATALLHERPEELRLIIHPSLAGTIPVLTTGHRADFVALVRALSMRNDPGPVPDSMGACMVAGFNNWDRVRSYRQQWEIKNPFGNWPEEFRSLRSKKDLYQDRFIILSEGPYSDVPAETMGIEQEEWGRLSLTIRLEHECAHYLSRRLLGAMHQHPHDELIADYSGIAAAAGRYRAEWFLSFMGLEAFPHYREGGRLQNYRGEPPLSEGAFQIVQRLVRDAAQNLEQIEVEFSGELSSPQQRGLFLLTLARLTLEELASKEARDHFRQAWKKQVEIEISSEDLQKFKQEGKLK